MSKLRQQVSPERCASAEVHSPNGSATVVIVHGSIRETCYETYCGDCGVHGLRHPGNKEWRWTFYGLEVTDVCMRQAFSSRKEAVEWTAKHPHTCALECLVLPTSAAEVE